MSDQPAEAVVSLEGAQIRRLTREDAQLALGISSVSDGRFLTALPRDVDGFADLIDAIGNQPWALPLLCLQDGVTTGFVLTGLPHLRNLNSYLLAVFTDPAGAALPLAMCVRHLFWNHPLHRLHTQLPVTASMEPYLALFRSAGFTEEGRLPGHADAEGTWRDVAVLGLLRDEFDEWCRAKVPALGL